MRTSADDPARGAERLLRWYPTSWRTRYGEEFTELLTSELAERPRSWRRTLDVVRSGLLARLTTLGLTSHALEPSEQIQASLASLGWALAVFVAFGASMWAQLTIGWQWARPNSVGTTAAMVVMSVIMLLFVALGLLAAVPLIIAVIGQIARRRGGDLIRPSGLFMVGSAFLILGARHFGNGWPGTGGHPWPHQGLVPGGVAAFLWASTLSISSYWAHPGVLLGFPGAELAWMAVSPLAMVGLVVGVTKIVRRLDLSPSVLRYERGLGTVATSAMAAFLVGSCLWIIDGGPGPRNLFHTGLIDIVGLAVMSGVVLIAWCALHRARGAGQTLLVR